MKKMYHNLILGLVSFAYICGTFLMVVLPDHPMIIGIVFSIAIIGTVILSLINRKKITLLMTSTYGRNVSNNIIGFFLVFCILALVNYIAFKRPKVFDLSDRRLNSLTAQSEKVISQIDEETTLTLFASKAHEENIRKFLMLYSNRNSNLVVKYVDPEIRPDLVSAHGVTLSPSIMIKNKKRSIIVTKMQELSMTNGLIQVNRQSDPVACFAYSPLLEEKGDTGFTGLLHILKSSAFKLKVVDLLKVKSIPSECQVFSILAPQGDFLDSSFEKVKKYHRDGGVLLTTFFPMFNGDKISNLRKYYKKNGLIVANNVVIDRSNSIEGSMGSAPIVKSFDNKGINTNLSGQVFFPLTTSIYPTKEVDDSYVALAISSPSSWAEATLSEIVSGNLQFDGKDTIGPVDIAGAVTVDSRPRLIAIGNSSMVSNKFYKFQANFNYMVNILHWTVGQDLLTSTRAAVFKEVPLFIGATHKRVIFYFSILALPLTLLLIAVVQFRRRRMS